MQKTDDHILKPGQMQQSPPGTAEISGDEGHFSDPNEKEQEVQNLFSTTNTDGEGDMTRSGILSKKQARHNRMRIENDVQKLHNRIQML